MNDAKEMWEAIKTRFGGNDESKKMQKYLLKQQFESFSVSNSEGLHKYDRFQSLLSQLETHGAGAPLKMPIKSFLDPRVNLEGTSGSKRDQVLALETVKDAQAKEILTLNARIKMLEKRCKPSISHHKAWLRSVAKLSKMKKLGQMEYVSKQGRKSAKPRPKLDDSVGLDADGVEYMETEEAVDEGRISNKTEELNLDVDTEVIDEDNGSGKKGEC
nr:ribonuclease H-like domain-containing protein [Tanacetum cinerariifolium]GEV98680.1 ribonuclease H-like domain-containing protein [Tanacetum cinerariifolium]